VHRFGNAIGAEKQNITGLEFNMAAVKLHVFEQANDHAAFGELEGLAARPHDDGGNVSAVNVVNGLAARVNEAQEHGHVFFAARVVQDHLVHGFGDIVEGMQVQNQRPQGGLQV